MDPSATIDVRRILIGQQEDTQISWHLCLAPVLCRVVCGTSSDQDSSHPLRLRVTDDHDVLGRQKSNSCAMRWATVTGGLCLAGCGIDFADTLCCCQDIYTATTVDVSGVRAILLKPVDKKALLRGIRMTLRDTGREVIGSHPFSPHPAG